MAKRISRSPIGMLHYDLESHWRNVILYGLRNKGCHPSSSHNHAKFVYRRTDSPKKCRDPEKLILSSRKNVENALKSD